MTHRRHSYRSEGIMEYTALFRVPKLEPHSQMQLSFIPRTQSFKSNLSTFKVKSAFWHESSKIYQRYFKSWNKKKLFQIMISKLFHFDLVGYAIREYRRSGIPCRNDKYENNKHSICWTDTKDVLTMNWKKKLSFTSLCTGCSFGHFFFFFLFFKLFYLLRKSYEADRHPSESLLSFTWRAARCLAQRHPGTLVSAFNRPGVLSQETLPKDSKEHHPPDTSKLNYVNLEEPLKHIPL